MNGTSSTTLSSAQTFIMKLVFPILWIGMFGLGTLAMWANVLHGRDNNAPPEGIKWMFLLMWVVGTAFVLTLCGGLKRIRVDDRNLYISNYFREISVPLSMIERVTENRWINIHPITIRFRSVTDFGDRVRFMPKIRFFGGWSSHPVVTELELLASNARSR